MRYLILTLGVLPYVGFAALDVWIHETDRRVPRVEKCLHLGIGLGVGGFLLLAFLGQLAPALAFLTVGLCFMAIDEFGYHGSLHRAERRLHGAAALALLLFLLVWLWTEFQL